MIKIKPSISFMFFLIILVTKVFGKEAHKGITNGKVMFLDQILVFNVEVVTTKTQRNIGLMKRPSLSQNNGMIFVFDQEELQRVWMKNMIIPLDVIFLSTKGKIVTILKGLQPCIKDPCHIFESKEKAKYMLEVNADIVQKTGIKIGQRVLFDF